MPGLEVHFLLVPHGAHFHRNPDLWVLGNEAGSDAETDSSKEAVPRLGETDSTIDTDHYRYPETLLEMP